MKFNIVIEKGKTGYGARVRELPGCIAVGKTKKEVLNLIQPTIDMHVKDLKKRGQWPPKK